MAVPVRTDRVDTALRRAFAAYALVVAVFCVVTLVPRQGGMAALPALTITFVVGMLTLAAVSWFRRPTAWLVAAVGVAGAGVFLAAQLSDPPASPEATAMVLAYLTGLIAVFARRLMALGVAILVACVVLIAVLRQYEPEAVVALGPAVAATTAMVLCVRLMERMDERFERARAEHTAAVAAAPEEEARLAAHHRAQAILHDDVLAALRAVGTPAVPREEAAASARRAWDALVRVDDDRHRTRDLVAALREIEVPGLSVDLSGARAALALPAPVTRALAHAVAEGLRNVVRHAGVTTARVVIRGDASHVAVEVSDRGRGFDPDRARTSYGLRESVHRRMGGIGGRAIVVSSPGLGTTLQLDWHARDWERLEEAAAEALGGPDLGPGAPDQGGRAPGDTLTALIGDPRVAAACAIVPFAVLALLWAWVGLASGQPAWLGVWALVLTGYGGYVLWRGEAGANPPWHEVLHVLGVAGMVAFLAQAPPGVLDTNLAWPISLAALTAAVTAIYRTGWSVIGLTAAFVGVVALFALLTTPGPDGAALLRAMPAILSTCWPLAIGATLRAVMIALGQRAEVEAALTRQTLARDNAARRQVAALDNRLTHLRTLLDPTLGRIARGEADLEDPRVQREALDAERAARDELTLPWSLTPALIRAIRAARASGVEITLTTTSDLVRTPPSARLLLQTVLEEASPRRVTLTVAADDAPVSLVAEVADDADRGAVIEALRSRGVEVRDVAGTLLARA